MSTFHVDSAAVAAASQQVAATVNAVRTEVSTLMANLRALESAWGGGASASFQAVAEQWNSAQIQVEEALDAISTQLATASATYEQAESQAAALFAG